MGACLSLGTMAVLACEKPLERVAIHYPEATVQPSPVASQSRGPDEGQPPQCARR
jgi:hypothetical protein